MTKTLFNLLRWTSLIGIFMLMQSCASTPDSRPKALIDAEYYQQQGTNAFYNDEYSLAADQFTRALKLYQSIDDHTGMLESHINLIETSIAIGNLKSARQQLVSLNGLPGLTDRADLADLADTGSNVNYRDRVILLRVKLLFNEQKYSDAISELQPILPEFNQNDQLLKNNPHNLNILSSMARFSVHTHSTESTIWLKRLELAINQKKGPTDRYQALLLRLQASHKQYKGDFESSKKYINRALTIYRRLAYRRGIAASLQQLANLEVQQQHFEQADNLLQRALNIHLWTLNKKATIKVLEELIKVNNILGNDQAAEEYSEQLNKLN